MIPITIIYCLVNPIDNSVFYVGKTTQKLNARLNSHVREKKHAVILRLYNMGLVPLIKQLQRCVGYLSPLKAERKWITKFKQQGILLSNVQLNKK